MYELVCIHIFSIWSHYYFDVTVFNVTMYMLAKDVHYFDVDSRIAM